MYAIQLNDTHPTVSIPELIRLLMFKEGMDFEQAFAVAQKTKQKKILNGERVHMARMAIYSTSHTNGVAALHTEILKNDVLKEWYTIFPERFQNKTNGITPRRWLGLCNLELSSLITAIIAPDCWIT